MFEQIDALAGIRGRRLGRVRAPVPHSAVRHLQDSRSVHLCACGRCRSIASKLVSDGSVEVVDLFLFGGRQILGLLLAWADQANCLPWRCHPGLFAASSVARWLSRRTCCSGV